MDSGTETFLTAIQTRARYGGVSHMWLVARLANDPTFPRPTYLGRLRFWKLSELELWEKLQAARPKKRPPIGSQQRGAA